MSTKDLQNEPYNLEAIEKTTILNCLEYHMGNIQLSSKKLGLSRATLYRKLKEYNLSVDSYREDNSNL